MGDWNAKNVTNLLSMLSCFQKASGLKVNLLKSKLIWVGVDGNKVEEWAGMVGCGVESLPFTYLGLPVGCNMNRCASWKPVIEKFNNRLRIWKARMTSFGGRLTLIKSVLGSLPLYFFFSLSCPGKCS